MILVERFRVFSNREELTRCTSGSFALSDCFDVSALRADFHFSVKTAADLENPFSHLMRLFKAKALQFRRFDASIISEAAERNGPFVHDSPSRQLDAYLPREFP